jgi:hypothetical protein
MREPSRCCQLGASSSRKGINGVHREPFGDENRRCGITVTFARTVVVRLLYYQLLANYLNEQVYRVLNC